MNSILSGYTSVLAKTVNICIRWLCVAALWSSCLYAREDILNSNFYERLTAINSSTGLSENFLRLFPTIPSGRADGLRPFPETVNFMTAEFFHRLKVVSDQNINPLLFWSLENEFRKIMAAQGLPVNLTDAEMQKFKKSPDDPLFKPLSDLDLTWENVAKFNALNMFLVVDAVKFLRQNTQLPVDRRYRFYPGSSTMNRLKEKLAEFLGDEVNLEFGAQDVDCEVVLAPSKGESMRREEAFKIARKLQVDQGLSFEVIRNATQP